MKTFSFIFWSVIIISGVLSSYGIYGIITNSSHPLEYYFLKKSIKNGEMIIKSRNRFSEGELIVIENKETKERYQLAYYFGYHKEFDVPQKAKYKSLVNSMGEFICNEDDDELVLKFLER